MAYTDYIETVDGFDLGGPFGVLPCEPLTQITAEDNAQRGFSDCKSQYSKLSFSIFFIGCICLFFCQPFRSCIYPFVQAPLAVFSHWVRSDDTLKGHLLPTAHRGQPPRPFLADPAPIGVCCLLIIGRTPCASGCVLLRD